MCGVLFRSFPRGPQLYMSSSAGATRGVPDPALPSPAPAGREPASPAGSTSARKGKAPTIYVTDTNVDSSLERDTPVLPKTASLNEDELELLVRQLRTPVGTPGRERAPVVVKDRQYRLRRYPQCFVARDFVDALLQLGYSETRRHAVTIGKLLCRRGMIHHVVDDHDFRDGYYFFRWYADELRSARSLSMRRASSVRGGSDNSSRNLYTMSQVIQNDSGAGVSSDSPHKDTSSNEGPTIKNTTWYTHPAAPQALAQKLPLAAQPLSLSVENSSPRATLHNKLS